MSIIKQRLRIMKWDKIYSIQDNIYLRYSVIVLLVVPVLATLFNVINSYMSIVDVRIPNKIFCLYFSTLIACLVSILTKAFYPKLFNKTYNNKSRAKQYLNDFMEFIHSTSFISPYSINKKKHIVSEILKWIYGYEADKDGYECENIVEDKDYCYEFFKVRLKECSITEDGLSIVKIHLNESFRLVRCLISSLIVLYVLLILIILIINISEVVTNVIG